MLLDYRYIYVLGAYRPFPTSAVEVRTGVTPVEMALPEGGKLCFLWWPSIEIAATTCMQMVLILPYRNNSCWV